MGGVEVAEVRHPACFAVRCLPFDFGVVVADDWRRSGVAQLLMDALIRAAQARKLETMEGLGASVERVSLPTTRYALACYYIIAPSECSANLARYDGVKYGYSYQDTDQMWEAMERTRQHGFGPALVQVAHRLQTVDFKYRTLVNGRGQRAGIGR